MVDEAVRVAKAVSSELQTRAGMEVWRNYLFDLPGPRVLPRSLSASEELFRTIFYGFTEIAEAHERLMDFEVYVRQFPYRRSRISGPRHLSYNIEGYLNEVYILQQRLLGYLRRIRRYAERRALQAEAGKVFETIERLVVKAFEGIIKTQGVHVH